MATNELGAFFGNPNVTKQGKKARELAAARDVNTLPDPQTYAFISGLLGEAPDQQGFSVMQPNADKIRSAGNVGFGVGLAAMGGPMLTKPLTAGAKALGPTATGMLENYMVKNGMIQEMISTPYGRIPENGKEVGLLADMLERGFAKNQPGLVTSSSAVSPSKYISAENSAGNTFQVRISDHADKYPELAIGTRFSVDPSTKNTFEEAVNWLNKNGVQNKLYAKYKDTPTFESIEAARTSVNSRLMQLQSAWLNQPKHTRGPRPTLDDVYARFPDLSPTAR